MIPLPPSIQTDRLALRPPRIEDAEAVFTTWASDPEVTRYLTWRPHASADETRAFLAHCAAAWDAQRGHRPWVIERRADARLLGTIGVTLEAQRASIGYALGRAFWGQGLMTEAARAVVDALLANPSICRVWAVCDVENAASARVLEKIGMTHEGVLRRWVVHPNRSPDPRDCRCYSIVR